MKNGSKKPWKWLAVFMALLLIVQVPAAYATSLSDLKQEQKKLQQEKDALNSSINEKSTEIKTNQTKQEQLLEQIQTLNAEINKTNKSIEQVVADINQANQEIAELEKDIAELQRKIDERNALLEERARAIQVGGTVSYLDVLLGANSFVDFIDRFSAVSTLIDADRQIMRDQKNDQEALEEQKVALENKKKQLEENQAKLESLKASLNSQKAEKNKLVDALEAEQAKLKNEKALLEEEYSEALELSKDVEAQIRKEQARLAEIARQQEANKNNGGGVSGNTPAVSAGTWTTPTTGRLTSPFGWRNIGYGNEFHYGVDIANSTGTPIVAAADGVVSYASKLSSYGNVIMITHSIDGQIWTTVYAHLNSFSVSVGDSVSKGQVIAGMGSTGRSTGPHLHFEMHTGTWAGARKNAVNPLRYISL
ncbi:peptidoglycan DD-metalloendopeptidase family protein [Lysinibacillus sp. KU-BSD001]|uniref:murein hydrolase activator EnvC family protein n=1 Tax=Lysinibacillus sp. KU-BSD001 TaxID=3141328 RepID=UPI0036E51AC8